MLFFNFFLYCYDAFVPVYLLVFVWWMFVLRVMNARNSIVDEDAVEKKSNSLRIRSLHLSFEEKKTSH